MMKFGWNQLFILHYTIIIFSLPFHVSKPPLKDTSEKHKLFLAGRRDKYALQREAKTAKYNGSLQKMRDRYAIRKEFDREGYVDMLAKSKNRSSENRLFKKYGRKMPGGRYDYKRYVSMMEEKDEHHKKQREFQFTADLIGTIHKGLSDVIGSRAIEHQNEITKLENEMENVRKAGVRPLYFSDQENEQGQDH